MALVLAAVGFVSLRRPPSNADQLAFSESGLLPPSSLDGASSCDASSRGDTESCDALSACEHFSVDGDVDSDFADHAEEDEEEDYADDYSDDGAYDDGDCDDDDGDDASSDSGDSFSLQSCSSAASGRRVQCWSLDEKAIQDELSARLAAVADKACLSEEHAGMLLRRFVWNVEVAVEEWYSNEEKLQAWLGLLGTPGGTPGTPGTHSTPGTATPHSHPAELQCGICLESISGPGLSAACGQHRFCRGCWAAYIDTSIASGAECLSLCCPHRQAAGEEGASCPEGPVPEAPAPAGCPAAVPDSMVLELASPALRDLFLRRRMQSMVDADKCLRWCPAPACGLAVQIKGLSAGHGAVSCLSGHSFCWSCGEEPHAPVDCDQAAQWMARSRKDGDQILHTLEIIKRCPCCRVLIEKVGACNEVQCQCQHKFCWSCLGPFEEHHEDCVEEEGLQRGQLENGQDLLLETDAYGQGFLQWLECETAHKAVSAALLSSLQGDASGRPRAKLPSTLLPSLEQLLKFWHNLKWKMVQLFFTHDKMLDVLLENQLECAKLTLKGFHDLAIGTAENYQDKDDASLDLVSKRLADLQVASQTFFCE